MACKRSAVRSRLPPPTRFDGTPSSSGLGHRPFTAVTGVRIPVGSPKQKRHPCDGVFVLAPFGLYSNPCSTTECPVDIRWDAARERGGPAGPRESERQSDSRAIPVLNLPPSLRWRFCFGALRASFEPLFENSPSVCFSEESCAAGR